MRISVIGYGHFAGVVSHGLTQRGYHVTAFDFVPPLLRPDQKRSDEEPGWSLTYDISAVTVPAADADLFWIAYDVPLTDAGAPNVTEILARIRRLHPLVAPHVPFLVSCQWPVGTMRVLAHECPGREFVYVMENVRVGKAIEDFARDPIPSLGLIALPKGVVWQFIKSLATVKEPWCSAWETIEFAKHAMNAFLALQIAFANELARLAPMGVDMADVTRVLRSDPRVSPKAPLLAGAPFGGGSLKRDLLVLDTLKPSAFTPIIASILTSNEGPDEF
jgi:UDPglucose 6-dehydrogenase